MTGIKLFTAPMISYSLGLLESRDGLKLNWRGSSNYFLALHLIEDWLPYSSTTVHFSQRVYWMVPTPIFLCRVPMVAVALILIPMIPRKVNDPKRKEPPDTRPCHIAETTTTLPTG